MKQHTSINSLMKWSFASLIFLMMVITFSYRYFVEIPKERAAIERLHKRELNALYFSLIDESENLKQMNYDYAIWDDTYNFVKNYNQSYLDNNYDIQTFTNLSIDAVFIIDNKNNILFSKGFDHLTQQELNFNDLLDDKGLFSSKIVNFKRATNQARHGIVKTKEGTMIFAITNISNSSNTAKSNGQLIYLKRFDQALTDNVADSTQLKLKVIPYDESYKEFPRITDLFKLTTKNQSNLWVVEDIYKQPSLVMQVEHFDNFELTILTRDLTITIAVQLLVMMFMFTFIKKILINPMNVVNSELSEIVKSKKLSALTAQFTVTEFKRLTDEFNHMVSTVENQQTQLEKLSLTDGLTQIPNRTAFEQHFTKELGHLQRNNTPFAIVMCDIDYFKKYNDSLGHTAGDDALKQVAQSLALSTRRVNDAVARYGGEEFIILFSGIELSALEIKLSEILENIRDLNIHHPDSDIAETITISLGAVLLTPPRDKNEMIDLTQVINIADKALYLAKHSGRNQFQITKEN
ncbi:diguanylate cyclase [Thalassomonas sp. M1454]|uniref:sensor domain-containing diguanylate cyclase n=1 Tax=Thalassomonas sp. M1454 TaxID=2594477 RepID=UPI00117BEE0E|nr:diguanylate cyclase [Thalassomonas sp. M1454]TRX54048.1 diguanylate cyclase [Thalassomonas sp. M1454]